MEIDKLLDVISEVRPQTLREEIHHLRTLREWAFAQQPFKVGDRVMLAPDYVLEQWLPPEPGRERKESGWWPYRECLVPGATATVSEVKFNPYAKPPGFRFEITLDREWAVSTWNGEEKRYEHEPGRKHVWGFSARRLRPIE